MSEIYDGVQEKIVKIQTKVGPSTGQQNKVIVEWWEEIARQHNEDTDPKFINDAPVGLVTKFLIKKGLVHTENEAEHLYKITNVTAEGLHKLKKVTREDFYKIFVRFIFIHALINVTK
jgi:hypothetical protein